LTQVTTAHQANMVFYGGTIGLLLGLAAREAMSKADRDSEYAERRFAR